MELCYPDNHWFVLGLFFLMSKYTITQKNLRFFALCVPISNLILLCLPHILQLNALNVIYTWKISLWEGLCSRCQVTEMTLWADFVLQKPKSGLNTALHCQTFLRENRNMFRLTLRDASSLDFEAPSLTNGAKALGIVWKFPHGRSLGQSVWFPLRPP